MAGRAHVNDCLKPGSSCANDPLRPRIEAAADRRIRKLDVREFLLIARRSAAVWFEQPQRALETGNTRRNFAVGDSRLSSGLDREQMDHAAHHRRGFVKKG
jgi:hypothetical protein